MYRTGIGWDVHPLVAGAALNLGCIHFPDAEKGLEGYSDADVVCHAICDALLGALALGDIGDHFPDDVPEFKDFPGGGLLERVRDMVAGKGYLIVNVDCTVMSDAVRLGARKKEMAQAIASHLGIESERVCVKATTWEGHGSVGRGEVIACEAVATVRRKDQALDG